MQFGQLVMISLLVFYHGLGEIYFGVACVTLFEGLYVRFDALQGVTLGSGRFLSGSFEFLFELVKTHRMQVDDREL